MFRLPIDFSACLRICYPNALQETFVLPICDIYRTKLVVNYLSLCISMIIHDIQSILCKKDPQPKSTRISDPKFLGCGKNIKVVLS